MDVDKGLCLFKKSKFLPCSREDFTTILELPEGRHEYKFFVDGQWLHDPGEVSMHSCPLYCYMILVLSNEATIHSIQASFKGRSWWERVNFFFFALNYIFFVYLKIILCLFEEATLKCGSLFIYGRGCGLFPIHFVFVCFYW